MFGIVLVISYYIIREFLPFRNTADRIFQHWMFPALKSSCAYLLILLLSKFSYFLPLSLLYTRDQTFLSVFSSSGHPKPSPTNPRSLSCTVTPHSCCVSQTLEPRGRASFQRPYETSVAKRTWQDEEGWERRVSTESVRTETRRWLECLFQTSAGGTCTMRPGALCLAFESHAAATRIRYYLPSAAKWSLPFCALPI